jgi:AbrB family looped-hinge helix DNA binding protein
MIEATVTSKGQITVPKAVREMLDLQPGDRLEFVMHDGRLYVRRRMDESPFDRYRGHLSQLQGRGSDEVIEEMRVRP